MTTDDLRTRTEAAAKRVWPDRPDADRITYPHAALQHYRQGAFVQGALWHAAQQPTRDQIARALDRAGAFCGDCSNEPGDFYDGCSQCRYVLNGYADAVLALPTGGESDE